MRKKIKIIILLFFLIILIVICKNILTFDSINYKLKINGSKIKIKETLNSDNYYIEIKDDEKVYPFRIYDKLNKKRKIVKEIYSYKDKTIECILPVINDQIYTDVMCYKDNILYDYTTLIGDNEQLDRYINSIDLYNLNDFKNNEIDTKNIGTVKYNIFSNFKNVVAISTYNGLIINDKEIKLFQKDIYNNDISVFIDNYYIIADYEKNYSFNSFYIVDLETKKVSKLECKSDISYDSYIQGIVDNKIYLYDKDNENQYEINIRQKSVSIVSSANYIKYYTNKKWEK